MVDEYMNEDDQAEVVKRWWRDNWLWVLSGIVLGLAGLTGWQYYQRYVAQRSEAAANTLNQFAAALVTDTNKATALMNEMTTKYDATPYAPLAHLLQAQHAVEVEDLAGAETALRAVMADNRDPELTQVAKLRLARVLIEQGKQDEALTLLDVSKPSGFTAQMHEIRGDALLSKQDQAAAIAEYQAALAAFQTDSSADVSLLQLKLADLGVSTHSSEGQTAAEPGAK